ncbi:MAG: adenosylmethionine decarboxylase [Planctomycetota bacterium]
MEKKNVACMVIGEDEKIVFGTHLVADFWGVSSDILDDPDHILQVLVDAARAADATVIDTCVHHFSPYGVTATVTLAESHISFHSWPEHEFCAIDVFVCGKADASRALRHVREMFKPTKVAMMDMVRGDLPRS